MCGIAGILDSSFVNPQLIEAMIGTIGHRGPDHCGCFTEGTVSLGYVRLGILDLSASANQPMTDASGNYVVVYNGEIYNFPALRKELQDEGVELRTSCDTEVVVNLFARHGLSGVSKLNGMFAFAVWSKCERELWIFRDPLGVKPLYWAFDGKRLLFGSEMKALHAASARSYDLAPEGVLNYLTYGHSVAPTTIYTGINKLLPGTYIHARSGAVSVSRYYHFPVPGNNSQPRRSEKDWLHEAESVLDAAVKRQMIADVPVGVFLSGGIDSGIITALMARHAGKLRTFTITYPGRPSYDESGDASTVASALGTDHHEIPFTEQNVTALLEKLAWHYDEPFGDAAAIPVYLLSHAARKHVKVVLSGEGGDEMFSGYRRYVAERSYALYRFVPGALRAAAIKAASYAGRARRVNRITRALAIQDGAERYAAWLQIFRPDALAWLLGDAYGPILSTHDAARTYRRLFAECRKSDLLGKLYYVDAQTWLPDTYLEKVDKASMAVSLEARVPLLDLEVVRFAATLPEKMRIRGTTTKYLLRRVAERLLPPGISTKPKRGLSVPTDPWFRGALSYYVRDILLDSRTRNRGIFKTAEMERLLSRHVDGRENCETQLWILLMFEVWFRAVADQNNRRPALAANL